MALPEFGYLLGMASLAGGVVTGAAGNRVGGECFLAHGPIERFAQSIQFQIASAVPVAFGNISFSPLVVIVRQVSVQFIHMLRFEERAERLHGILLGFLPFSQIIRDHALNRALPQELFAFDFFKLITHKNYVGGGNGGGKGQSASNF